MLTILDVLTKLHFVNSIDFVNMSTRLDLLECCQHVNMLTTSTMLTNVDFVNTSEAIEEAGAVVEGVHCSASPRFLMCCGKESLFPTCVDSAGSDDVVQCICQMLSEKA